MPDHIEPPLAASRLLSCFSDAHLPQILGDLTEEFNERVRSTGASAARRWYWREVVRNAVILLRHQDAFRVGAAALGLLAVIHGVMIFAAGYAWHEWISATTPIVNGLPVKPWMSWYDSSWRMAFPPAGLDTAREFYVAIAAGLGFGAIFAHRCGGRLQAFRMAVICGWLVISIWFAINAIFLVHVGTMWHSNGRLIVDFALRESLAAGSFWVGTYLILPVHWRQRLKEAK